MEEGLNTISSPFHHDDIPKALVLYATATGLQHRKSRCYREQLMGGTNVSCLGY